MPHRLPRYLWKERIAVSQDNVSEHDSSMLIEQQSQNKMFLVAGLQIDYSLSTFITPDGNLYNYMFTFDIEVHVKFIVLHVPADSFWA